MAMKVLDQEAAKVIARATLDAIAPEDTPVLLQDTETEVTSDGWVFFWQSEKYVQTGSFRYQLVGNCPIYVRHDGSVKLLPIHCPWEQSVEEADRQQS